MFIFLIFLFASSVNENDGVLSDPLPDGYETPIIMADGDEIQDGKYFADAEDSNQTDNSELTPDIEDQSELNDNENTLDEEETKTESSNDQEKPQEEPQPTNITKKPPIKKEYLLEDGFEEFPADTEENDTVNFEISLNLPLKHNPEAETNSSEGQKKISFVSNKNAVVHIVCNGPNTRKGKKGFCECMDGFEHGDPSSRYGCYHCSSICHIKAECVYPGRCSCKNGMVGDGIKNCSIPVPTITRVDTLLVPAAGGENITVFYYTPTNYSQTYAYCKFGSIVVKGNILNDGELVCAVPPSTKQGLKLFVSFDSETWSTNNLVIMYQQKYSWLSFFVKLFMFLLTLAGIVYYIYKRQQIVINPEIDLKAEQTPFNMTAHAFNDFEDL